MQRNSPQKDPITANLEKSSNNESHIITAKILPDRIVNLQLEDNLGLHMGEKEGSILVDNFFIFNIYVKIFNMQH